jgi:hypothetical protein
MTMKLDQQTQTLLRYGALGSPFTGAHCLTHQPIVNRNARSRSHGS